jgi:hypothetical protein
MSVVIVPIVEGQGEEKAVRIVIGRITAELNLSVRVEVVHPFRVKRHSFFKAGEFERKIEEAAIRAISAGGEHRRILVLIDSDGDCPLKLAPQLLERAWLARPDIPVSVVLAHCEFEAWYLASASSLRGCCELSAMMEDHPGAEGVQGAKEWLREHMPPNRRYSETVDQPALAAIFDMKRAREGSRSFRKFWQEIERILRDAAGQS